MNNDTDEVSPLLRSGSANSLTFDSQSGYPPAVSKKRNEDNVREETNDEPDEKKEKLFTVKESKGLSRFFFVEIIITLYFLSDYPISLIVQKYIVNWTTEEFIKRDLARNITHYLNETIPPCSANVSIDDFNFQQDIQSHASMISAIQSVVRGVPAIFSTMIIGAASDKLGCRYAILSSCFGILLYSIAVLIVTMHRLPVWYIFIADFFNGCLGLMYGVIIGSSSYLAAYIPNDRLATRLSIMSACALAPMMLSSSLVGILVSSIGYWQTVLITVVFLASNLLYVLIFMKESTKLPVEISGQTFLRDIQTRITSTLSLLSRKSSQDGNRTAVRFGLLLFTMFFVAMSTAEGSVAVYFAMNSPLCWDLKLIGWYSGACLAASALGSVVVLPLEKRCMGDNLIAMVSTGFGVISSVYKFFVQATAMMFIVPVFSIFTLQVHSCVRTLLSGLVGKHRQGAIFGVTASIEVICSMIGTVIFNAVYSQTVYIATGFVFLVISLVYLSAGILLTIHYFIHKKEKQPSQFTNIQNVEDDSA